MKSFRYKFNGLTWILLSVVLAISLVGAGFNIYNLVFALKGEIFVQKVIISCFVLAVNLFLIAFVISVMLFSKYAVKQDCVLLYFGIIRSKTKLNEILQFTHFKKSNKLVAYFNNQQYSVIVISPNKYDEFVNAVRENNPSVYYDSQSEEEQT